MLRQSSTNCGKANSPEDTAPLSVAGAAGEGVVLRDLGIWKALFGVFDGEMEALAQAFA